MLPAGPIEATIYEGVRVRLRGGLGNNGKLLRKGGAYWKFHEIWNHNVIVSEF